MGLLGEISKSSEALRYHSRTAEVAGQNLAHVNDESYARQRVLAKEGVMYTSAGGLLTSGLSAGGVDHARNDILDSRVINEKGDSASLAAQQEILEILQAALGEKITRQGVNVGLDDLHESDLAPGSLTRAINDFFNSFQELSASPYEPTIKQELFHKIDTLTKRFNEAGHSLENLESDISEIIQRSVSQVNTVLAQIHEANTQVRRFELLDQGKATMYRDQRQKLFEELGSYINFSKEDDVSAATGKESGFVNLFVEGANGQKISILDSAGPQPLSNDWGKELTLKAPVNELGTAAKVLAKVDSNGQLGRLEVIDGGSLYDDAGGPFLVSILPPQPTNVADANNATLAVAKKKGDVFFQSGAYYQALADTIKGDTVTDPTKFLAISDPINGVVSETKRTFSDVDFIPKGQQVYYEGKLYQATTDVGAVTSEVGSVDPESGANLSSRGYNAGEVFKFNDNFFQSTQNVGKGFDLDSLSVNSGVVNNAGVLSLGANLPKRSEEANLAWPNGNALLAGEVVSFVNPNAVTGSSADFYMAINAVDATSTELPHTSLNFVKLNSYVDDSVQTVQSLPQQVTKNTNGVDVTNTEINFEAGEIYYDETSLTHFLVKAKPESIVGEVEIGAFNPNDAKWLGNFHIFSTDPASGLPPTSFLRRANPGALNTSNGTLEELNIGVAEAIIQNGEIKSFNILQSSSGLPSTDSLFINGEEIVVKSGSIHGYQQARAVELEDFRISLNSLVSEFVTQVNKIYNPDDAPGNYLFGYQANLTRPTMGSNLLMEDQFGLYGVEGNGDLTLFRNEVNMTLPYSEGDTFTITNASPIVPLELKDQFEGTGYIIRDFDDPNDTDDITEDKEPGVTSLVYGSAKSMQNVTMETDLTYPGEDLLLGNDDDGRSIMLAYENIPFKMVQGGSTFVLGDNYSFDAVLENSWNLASSLIVDNDLTAESLVASLDFDQGANDIALKIAELGNGEFSKDISDINADLGNSLADLNDNIDHQKTIEDLLLEQRNAVSSVSIDEEVADLMQFQRSFQASSRVLNTLDKMLELVVMGLIK